MDLVVPATFSGIDGLDDCEEGALLKNLELCRLRFAILRFPACSLPLAPCALFLAPYLEPFQIDRISGPEPPDRLLEAPCAQDQLVEGGPGWPFRRLCVEAKNL